MQTIDSYVNKLTCTWREKLDTDTNPSKNTSIDNAKGLTFRLPVVTKQTGENKHRQITQNAALQNSQIRTRKYTFDR